MVNVTLKNGNRERVQWEMEVDVFNSKVSIESEARYNLLLSLIFYTICYTICLDMLRYVTICYNMLHDMLHDTSRQSSTIFEMLCWGEQSVQSVAKVELYIG